jgi:hypothetical protein
MRTLGPGSIASVLKIALDVTYALIWSVLLVVVLASLVGVLAAPFLGGRLHGAVTIDGRQRDLEALVARWPLVLAASVAVCVDLAVQLVIVFRLRQVFATLILGDPFRPENVGRLRLVGLGLIALEAVGYVVRFTFLWAFPEPDAHVSANVSLSGWFAILVVFVLAEVFRLGARLRRDAELTI